MSNAYRWNIWFIQLLKLKPSPLEEQNKKVYDLSSYFEKEHYKKTEIKPQQNISLMKEPTKVSLLKTNDLSSTLQ